MSERPNAGALREAYDQLNYELVESTETLSVPVSNRARFEYADSPDRCDAEKIREHIERSGFSFTDALAQNGEKWYEFSVTGELWNGNDEGELVVTVSTAGVSLMRRHRDVSFRAFKHAVRMLEDALVADLQYVEDDDGE